MVFLVVVVPLIVTGKGTAEITYTQTDLYNCCDNCWATYPGGTVSNPDTVTCPTSHGPVTLSQICDDLGITDFTHCSQIPLCRR